MKIVSNFQDYYDSGMAWGQDSSVVYKRLKIKEEGFNPFPKYDPKPWYREFIFPDFSSITVGFCGKVYGCIKILHKAEQIPFAPYKPCVETYCYSVDDVDRYVEKHFTDKEKSDYYAKGKRDKYGWVTFKDSTYVSRSGRATFKNNIRRYFVEEYFEKSSSIKNNYQDIFIDKKSPIFISYFNVENNNPDRYTIFNDELKSVQFMKVFDPVMAFQELFMFMGGMASPEKEIPEISDTDMRDAKGFDNWSFKNKPSK